MKLSELRTGMVVETQEYGFYLVLCTEKETLFIRNSGYNNQSCYNEDLTVVASTEYNIIAVYKINQGQAFKYIFNKENLTLLWEREIYIDYNTYVGRVCRFWNENEVILAVYCHYRKGSDYPHGTYENNYYSYCELLIQEEIEQLRITHD